MSESQAAVREICDAIIKRVDRAYVAECGRKNEFPQKLWDMWVDTGLLSMGLSEEFGGSGGSLKDIVLALDLLHQEALLLPIAVTNFMSREPIMHHATQAQKERYLPPTATGEEFFSFGITEPDSGTNTFKIKTTAIRQPDGTFLLNGGKTYQTAFVESNHCLLVARTAPLDSSDRTHGISLFIVDTKLPGISATPMNIGMYLPEQQYQTYFDNVVLPADSLVGEEGKGLSILFSSLNSERLLVSAMNLGQADYVLKRAAEYAKVRSPFGVPIGSYQSIAHPMARAKTYIEAARLMMYQACDKHDRKESIALDVNMVKILSSEAFKMAAEIAMTTFGGAGVDVSQDILPFYIAAQNNTVAPVNNQVVLSFIAEKALGLPKCY
ncbi:acyl-CoA dehydrogenase family protein [Pseudomonas abietaniphila]|uniref:acyl-CoA dehydrogenase family protein n=1 Tax=Pseudomonas abietaniphila TaxID=89065 RepID=UPI000AB534D3|nr:acyl-CoA dehydrogenase family protein [Pseudomonas abietaniphila]